MNNYISPQEYQQTLFDKFNSLTAEEFVQLLMEAKKYLNLFNMDIQTDEEEQRSEFIKSVIETCKENRNISFKQWKALNAFINSQKKNQTTKQF